MTQHNTIMTTQISGYRCQAILDLFNQDSDASVCVWMGCFGVNIFLNNMIWGKKL